MWATDRSRFTIFTRSSYNLFTDCKRLTDQGLQYLKGVHTINLSSCDK